LREKTVTVLAITALSMLLIGIGSTNEAKADTFLNCTLTVISPNASFNYTNTMPLDLIIVYENKTNQPIIWIQANVTCAIDQGNPINITSLPSYAHPEPNGTLSIPVSQSVNINGLEDGQHTLTVTVKGYYDLTNLALPDFNQTFSPIYFYVGSNSTPSPTPSPIFTASLAESASSLYFGNTINFTVTADNGKEPYAYSWNVDNQTIENTTLPYYSLNSLGTGEHHVFVIVTDANNHTATTLTVAFTVLPNPSSSLSPSPSPSVAEFPNWIILPLMAVAATMIVYLRRRRKL
jgi:hypothetical protein